MNIIKIKELPDACPMCGSDHPPKTIACSYDCVRANATAFIVTNTVGDSMGSPSSHVHFICVECGFVYLVEPEDMETLTRLW